LKFAAIDIGSNAVRILFCNVIEHVNGPYIRKSSLVRVPVRLGEDVFNSGVISKEKTADLVKAMAAFKNLMEVQRVVAYRACATSAMREAVNGAEVVKTVKENTGIDINIISGDDEAEFIFYGIHGVTHSKQSFLYIDVGGGSTELSLFVKGERVASQSFNIGTLRLLQKKETDQECKRLKKWIKDNLKPNKNIVAVGTGGNINKIYKLAKKKSGESLSIEKLKAMDEYLNKFSYEERILTLGLNPDRADVIVHASKLFITIMKTAGIKKIIVPQIGLSDGIIKILAEEYTQKKAMLQYLKT
jgi:exopolyphosphatase / guanosine-5'-triphosphate,3'-diphosphate pyrophosphatase